MNKSFWDKLKKPIFALAPMADVTDAAFRRIIAARGKPDVMFTEFVSADGLALAPEGPARTADGHRSGGGRKKLMMDLIYSEAERPIVAQFFTSNPSHMAQAAALARRLGFDGIDINMGCPAKVINRQEAGACLIKTPELAREIICAAKEGAPNLPISIKTRIGYNHPSLDTWLPEILKENPAAVTLHARTAKEMSKVPAQWEYVKRAVEIRDSLSVDTLIIGNGDVSDRGDALEKIRDTGCDGIMFGRAIFGNPWLFSSHTPSVREKLLTLAEHAQLFENLLGGVKSFAIMKKHFKAYVASFDKAGELRTKLMEASNAGEVGEIIESFVDTKRPL